MSHRLTPFIWAVLSASLLVCCSGRRDYRTMQGMVWATAYHIAYDSPINLDDSIIDIMRQVDNSLSPFVGQSTVSRINRGDTLSTDSLLREVFAESKAVNRLSGGAFDPTVGPLINLWGFGTSTPNSQPPSRAAVDSALALVGINQCHIDSLTGVMTKKSAATQFNFSAIAKGYGVDLIGRMMRRNGVTNYMIEIGGEIAVSGQSPRATPWRIKIDAPVESADSVVHDGGWVISVDSCGIATSGNYRNYRDIDGRRVGHTISPATGRPAQSEVLSATVIAPTCMQADALATACMVLPLDSARALIGRVPHASALFVTQGDKTRWAIHTTSGFPSIQQ